MGKEEMIYLGFSVSKGVLAHLIQEFTRSNVNHAFFVYYSLDLAHWVTVGANVNGVTMLPLDKFDAQGRTVVEIYAPKFDLLTAVRDHAGVSDEEAAQRMAELVHEKRYIRDVWS